MGSRKHRKDELRKILKQIRMVIMDSDGVLTDGRIIYGSDGTDYRSFHTHDGYGMNRAMKSGLILAIISGSTSRTLEQRAAVLGVSDTIQGSSDKFADFEILRQKHSLQAKEVCFIGDDEFDLPLLEKVGWSVAPANAVEAVRRVVDFVTDADGGKGAVREVLDLILRAQGRLK